jgi:hypothetical protein
MLEKSLKLLQTDHIDLWQLHDIGTMTDIDEIFAKGGAMEALIEARDQKIVKYLGITGHYRPDALMEAIHRYPFDTILMAVNAADPHHYSFSEQLLPLAVEKQMGIIGMKVPARGRILSTWTPPPIEQQKHSWEGMVVAPHSRDACHASGDVLFALTAGQHGDHRLRFDRATGRKRPIGAGIHTAQPTTDGYARGESGAGFEAVVILPVLREGLGNRRNELLHPPGSGRLDR